MKPMERPRAPGTGNWRDTIKGPFAVFAATLLLNGYSPVPILPKTKRPPDEGWNALRVTPLTEEQVRRQAAERPAYGLGVAGEYGGLVPIDIDTDDADIIDAVCSALPAPLVAKKGRTGYTAFYRAPEGWIATGRKFKPTPISKPIVEILATGQTVIPPTLHPDTGAPYQWLTPATLLNTPLAMLPRLDVDFVERLAEALRPWCSGPVKQASPKASPPAHISDERLRIYALDVLHKRADEIAGMPDESGRNIALLAAVSRVGSWVHHNIISESEMRAAFHGAYDKCGAMTAHGKQQFAATVRNGLKLSSGDELRTPENDSVQVLAVVDVASLKAEIARKNEGEQSNVIELSQAAEQRGKPTKPPEDPFGPEVHAMAAKLVFKPYQCVDPTTIPPRDWLYDQHYIRGYVSMLGASGGTGKTQMNLAQALAMVTGKAILGIPVRKPLNVFVWNGEDPLEEIQRRFEATRFHYGVTPEDVKGRIYLESGRDAAIKTARVIEGSQCQILEPITSVLLKFFQGAEVDVAMFDPFVSSHDVPENDNGKIDAVVKTWGRIAGDAKCSIELVHHLRKGNGQEKTIEDARGAVALIDGVRSARIIARLSEKEAPEIGIEPGDAWRYFRITDGKANMAPPASRSRWFKLESIGLHNGMDEKPADEVGVVTTFKPQGAFDDVTHGQLDELFRDLRMDAGRRYNNKASDWFGHLVAQHMEMDVKDPIDKKRITDMIAAWKKSGAIKIESRWCPRQSRDHDWVMCGNWFENR